MNKVTQEQWDNWADGLSKKDKHVVEKMARAECIVDGLDPDYESIGFGSGIIVPVNQKYKLWESRKMRLVGTLKAFKGEYNICQCD